MQLINPILVEEIAAFLGAELIAGAADRILGLNEIHKVQVGDLSFVDHQKYYQKALLSAASVVLINTKLVENPHRKTLLYSNDPFRDYNALVRRYTQQPILMSQAIHQEAVIGAGTVVQTGAVVGRAKIGENCLIYPNVVIYDGSIIGDNVVIHANSVIGADAFYFKRRPEGYDKLLSCGRVLIENDVEIGAGCTIDRGVSGDTIIGSGTKIDNHVHIGHGVVVGQNCLFAAQVGIGGKTIIGNNVILWGQVGVSKDLHIGDGAVVLAQSGVAKSLAGGKTYFGSPAEEARQKMKELAWSKQVPEIWRRLTEQKE